MPPDRHQQLTELYDLHYAGLCRLAAHLLCSTAQAEEVVQEAFLRTFAGWARIRQPERASWYLRTTVVNLCRSRMRRRTTEDRGNRTVWASARDVEWPGEHSEDVAAVLDAVRALPQRQREAVVLRYYEDLAEADIARILHCSTGTVKSQLSKARATLAGLLTLSLSEEP